jgi:hypothetical protein
MPGAMSAKKIAASSNDSTVHAPFHDAKEAARGTICSLSSLSAWQPTSLLRRRG